MGVSQSLQKKEVPESFSDHGLGVKDPREVLGNVDTQKLEASVGVRQELSTRTSLSNYRSSKINNHMDCLCHALQNHPFQCFQNELKGNIPVFITKK